MSSPRNAETAAVRRANLLPQPQSAPSCHIKGFRHDRVWAAASEGWHIVVDDRARHELQAAGPVLGREEARP
jgi:hypothetical protein